MWHARKILFTAMDKQRFSKVALSSQSYEKASLSRQNKKVPVMVSQATELDSEVCSSTKLCFWTHFMQKSSV